MPNRIDKLELDTFVEEDDVSELPPPNIVAFNELRSCTDLLRMYNDNILNIQPGYQREIVWKTQYQTRPYLYTWNSRTIFSSFFLKSPF